jgi:hypothetical protein
MKVESLYDNAKSVHVDDTVAGSRKLKTKQTAMYEADPHVTDVLATPSFVTRKIGTWISGAISLLLYHGPLQNEGTCSSFAIILVLCLTDLQVDRLFAGIYQRTQSGHGIFTHY